MACKVTKTVEYGNTYYRNSKGQFHRENDLPAVVFANGSKLWYKNGQRHRENDLPAIVFADGSKLWYKNGQLHRENDLPAIECADGDKYWHKNGKEYTPPTVQSSSSFEYSYHNKNEGEKITLQVQDNGNTLLLSAEDSFECVSVALCVDEVERLIAGLQAAREKMK